MASRQWELRTRRNLEVSFCRKRLHYRLSRSVDEFHSQCGEFREEKNPLYNVIYSVYTQLYISIVILYILRLHCVNMIRQ